MTVYIIIIFSEAPSKRIVPSLGPGDAAGVAKVIRNIETFCIPR